MTTVLRPMSTSELLDRTFFLYRKHFVLFVGIVAVPYLILLAFQLASLSVPRARPEPTGILWVLLSALVYLIALAAAQAGTVVAVSDVHLERPVTIGSALGSIKGRLFQLTLIMVAVWIGVGVGLALLIIPGIIFALMWSLTIPVAVLERQGLRGATSRSAALTKDNRGRIFLIVLLFLVLVYIVTVMVQAPIVMAVSFSHLANPRVIPPWFRVLSAVGSFVSNILVAPLLTIALSLVYYDERVRKEGFDLQFMISSLESPQPNPQGADAS
jgi:hypothetical protein